MNTKNLIKALVHLLCWCIGFWLSYLAFQYSNSKYAYGLIVGWWMACYVGYIIGIRANVVLPALVIYMAICIVSTEVGHIWFYHDAEDSLTFDLFIVIFLQGLIFISPIVINEIVDSITHRLNKIR